MRRILLSVGVPAVASLRERKSPGVFRSRRFLFPRTAFTHPDTLSLIFQPLNFSTKKTTIKFHIKKTAKQAIIDL